MSNSEVNEATEDFLYWECDSDTFIDLQSHAATPNEDMRRTQHVHAHPLVRLKNRVDVQDPPETDIVPMSQSLREIRKQLESIMEILNNRLDGM